MKLSGGDMLGALFLGLRHHSHIYLHEHGDKTAAGPDIAAKDIRKAVIQRCPLFPPRARWAGFVRIQQMSREIREREQKLLASGAADKVHV
jgi:hypothetical protein